MIFLPIPAKWTWQPAQLLERRSLHLDRRVGFLSSEKLLYRFLREVRVEP